MAPGSISLRRAQFIVNLRKKGLQHKDVKHERKQITLTNKSEQQDKLRSYFNYNIWIFPDS